jgi:sugar lactone lactonase YvrE
VRYLLAIASLACAQLLLGCSVTQGPSPTETASKPVSGATLQGIVHGGQQPIVGASVYLYAANTTGSGGVSVSLLTSAGGTTKDANGNYFVTTGSGGTFTITGDFTCPNASSQVYIYALGGNPGSGTNSGAGLMAAVGSCNSLTSSSFLFVDEVSTIATAYSVAGFATDATHVSSAGTSFAKGGVANAFATVASLETLSTGVALATTPAGNGAVPQNEINTLANILAACINSTGPTSSSCNTLFTNATNGSSAPADTATAAINMAHHPGANVAALFALQIANGPFQPVLSAVPNDFTISIAYAGGGLNGPLGIAIDASGNVWTANANAEANTLSEFSPAGAPLSGTSGFTGGGLNRPNTIAIDSSGNVWAANPGNNSVSELASTGSPISSVSGYTGGGLNTPTAIAADLAGDAWIANSGNNSISEFAPGGAPVTGTSGYTGGGLSQPSAIAIDNSGDVWAANPGNNSVTEFTAGGSPVSNSTGFTGGGLNTPSGIAIDTSGDAWIADAKGNSITELSYLGSPISGSSGFTGAGLNSPNSIAIDGSGDVWAPNSAGSSISELASSGTPISGSSGYKLGTSGQPLHIAIDGSGNAWVTTSNPATITEFIGVAAPTVAPIAAAIQLPPYGTPPAIIFSTTSLSSGATLVPYTATISASGGVGPLTYAVTSGSLPAGITLSSAGALSGTPTIAGTSTFTVTASDAYGDLNSESLSVAIAMSGTNGGASIAIGTVAVNGKPRSLVLYPNGAQLLAYACSDSQINIIDVTNPASPSVLSTFAGSMLTDGGTYMGYGPVNCAIDGSTLVVSFGFPEQVNTYNPTQLPTYFAAFSLANPLSPAQIGTTVAIDRPGSTGFLLQGNTAFLSQQVNLYNEYSGFIYDDPGDVWSLDLTNLASTGAVSFIGDLYPCGGINSSTGNCNNTTNVPAATYNGSTCVRAGTTPIPNDPYQGGPYPIYEGLLANSTTAYFPSSSANSGNVEAPTCPPISGQLLVVDTTTPPSLAIAANVAVPQAAYLTGVAVQGNTAVAVGDSAGIYSINSGFVGSLVIASFDITNPKSPVLLDSFVTTLTDSRGPTIVPIGNNSFLVGNLTNGSSPALVLVNASNPGALTYTYYGSALTSSPIAVSSSYIYLLSSTPSATANQLSIFPITAF